MMRKYCHQHHLYLIVVEHVPDGVKVQLPAPSLLTFGRACFRWCQSTATSTIFTYLWSSMFQMMLKYCCQHHLYLLVVEHVSDNV